jgi:hypothetical protein
MCIPRVVIITVLKIKSWVWNDTQELVFSLWCMIALWAHILQYRDNWIWLKWEYGDDSLTEMVWDGVHWWGFCEHGDCQSGVSIGGPVDENKGAVARQDLSYGSCRGSWRNMAAGRKVCHVSLLPSCPPPIMFQTPFVFRYPWVNFFLLYFSLVDLYH